MRSLALPSVRERAPRRSLNDETGRERGPSRAPQPSLFLPAHVLNSANQTAASAWRRCFLLQRARVREVPPRNCSFRRCCCSSGSGWRRRPGAGEKSGGDYSGECGARGPSAAGSRCPQSIVGHGCTLSRGSRAAHAWGREPRIQAQEPPLKVSCDRSAWGPLEGGAGHFPGPIFSDIPFGSSRWGRSAVGSLCSRCLGPLHEPCLRVSVLHSTTGAMLSGFWRASPCRIQMTTQWVQYLIILK